MGHSSFDKYSFDDSNDRRNHRKNRNGSFDDWYGQFSHLRDQWQREKRSLKEDLRREAADFRNELRRSGGGHSAGQLVGGTIRMIANVIEDAVQSSSNTKRLSEGERLHLEQVRRREDEYYRLTRKIESTERRVEKKRKSSVVMGIIAAAFGISAIFDWEMAPAVLIFGGLSAFNVWQSGEAQRKLNRLYAERDNFGALPAAPSYSQETEKTILRHAFERQGRVYPEILAINSDLSLGEIEQMLKICVEKHLATIELDDKGRTYYYFSSLDNSDASSEDPYANLGGTPT
jgi:predicted phage tail protein